MIATFYKEGKVVDYTPAAAVAAGDIVIIGDIVGVAKLDIAAGERGALALEGIFAVAKGSTAFDFGAKVYFNAESGVATNVETDTLIGVATAAAAASDATVLVKIG